MDTFSVFGNSASIIGFMISGYTAYLVFSIRKKFLFNVKIDSNLSNLKKNNKEIVSLLQDYNEKENEIIELLSIIDVALRDMQKAAKDNLLKDINEARTSIDDFTMKDSKKNEQNVRNIKRLISRVIEELTNVKTEIRVGN